MIIYLNIIGFIKERVNVLDVGKIEIPLDN